MLCLAKGAGSVLAKMRRNLLKWQSLATLLRSSHHSRESGSPRESGLLAFEHPHFTRSLQSSQQHKLLAHRYDYHAEVTPPHYCWLPRVPPIFFY